MDDWLSYTLADFLLFSPEAYWRLVALVNTAVWPLPVLTPVALSVAVYGIVRGWRHAGWISGLALATSWALVAHVYLADHYAAINWAVASITPLTWGQVCLVLVLFPGLRLTGGARLRWLAYGLVALSLAYPVVGFAAGRPLAQSEVTGIAPDPTALMTLGLLALAAPSWRGVVLSILPICWLLFSAATLFAMVEPTAWVLVVSILIFVFLHLCAYLTMRSQI